MRERTPADLVVRQAYNRALLDIILPGMFSSAETLGYKIIQYEDITEKISLFIIPLGSSVATLDDFMNSMVSSITSSGAWSIRDRDEKLGEDLHGRLTTRLIVFCGDGRAIVDLHISSVKETTSSKSFPEDVFFKRLNIMR